MGGRNVVQDSDDEDEAVSVLPTLPDPSEASTQLTVSTIIDLPLSSPAKHIDFSFSADQSTESTDILTRQIHDAHLSLLEPTPESGPSGEKIETALQKNIAAPSAKEKKPRRATTGGLKRGKKVAKTYATEASLGDIYDFRGSSDGELDIVPRKRRKLEELPATGANIASGVVLKANHDAAVKDSYAIREDDATNVTTPKLSSNTGRSNEGLSSQEDTNSRILEQLRSSKIDFLKGKARLAIGVQDLIPPLPLQQPGIPHSQMSSTTTIPFTTPGDSPESATRTQTGQLASLPSSVQGKLLTSFTGSIEDPIERSLHKGQAVKKSLTAPKNNLHARRPSTPDELHPHTGADADERALIDTEALNHDDLSLLQQPEIQDKQLNNDNHRNQPDELESDDMGISLPKEQYQPRPSRSRSSRTNDNIIVPANFSKRPETLIKAKEKAKNKRRKTTGGEKYLHEDVETDEMYSQKRDWDVAESPKKGSSPAKTPTKKSKQRPDYKEIEEGDDVAVTTKSSEGKKKRGRPRKSIEIVEDTGMVETPQELENELPEKSTRIKTTTSNKSRKRKKTAEAPHLIEDHSDLDDNAETNDDENQPFQDEAPVHALSETEANTRPPKAHILPPPNTSSISNKEKTPSPTKPQTQVQTPQKPTDKGPDKHSPLNRGKISYRVGLSKRARIAPLLRIVGK